MNCTQCGKPGALAHTSTKMGEHPSTRTGEHRVRCSACQLIAFMADAVQYTREVVGETVALMEHETGAMPRIRALQREVREFAQVVDDLKTSARATDWPNVGDVFLKTLQDHLARIDELEDDIYGLDVDTAAMLTATLAKKKGAA